MVVEGRYLRPDDDAEPRVQEDADPEDFLTRIPTLPVVASTRTFVSERLDVTIERLDPGDPLAVPQVLASGGALGFLQSRPTQLVEERSYDPQSAYEGLLGRLASRGAHPSPFNGGVEMLWLTAPPTYQRLDDRLQPIAVDVDDRQLRPPAAGSVPRSQPPVSPSKTSAAWSRGGTPRPDEARWGGRSSIPRTPWSWSDDTTQECCPASLC